MLRSPYAGVPQEVGAAYAALFAREGALLDLIGEQRIAHAPARDALLHFLQSVRSLHAGSTIEDISAAFPAVDREYADGAAAPELAEPQTPEPGTAVRTANARFSASQLNTYAECPRKWYYRYVCSAVEDKGSSASFYGTAFHAALEEFHGIYPQPSAAHRADMDLKATGYVNAAFERFRNKFDTPVEYELQLRRARRTVLRYVQWLVEQSSRAPFTVVGCEVAAELQIEGFDFIGYIDRLDREDETGNVAVIDYKTGSIATTAAEYREKVRTFRDFQLPFYYWARTASGDRVTRLALIPLKDALADVRPVELEVIPVPAAISRSAQTTGVIPIAELQMARVRMGEICAELVNGNTTAFAVATDPEACTYCAYTASCINRPQTLEARFGR